MDSKSRLIAAGAVLVLTLSASVFTYFSLEGKYAFREEPQLLRQEVVLEKRPLSERERLENELFRDKLLLDSQRTAYDAISWHTFQTDDSLFQLKDTDKNDLEIALNAFRADHPEVFWLNTSSCYRYLEEDDSVTVEMDFIETDDDLWQDRQALEAAIKEAISGAPDNANDYDIELYLNDYLSEHCQYGGEGAQIHTAYGALVNGAAVCDGYSRAFQLLCRRLGVECTVVEGTSDFNQDADSGHMWNCVYVGGEWYHADVTWNDAEEMCGVEHYFYLNLTDEQISRDHVISGSFEDRTDNPGNYFNVFVPECACDDLNYLRLNCAVIDDPEDDEQIIASLIDAARNRREYCAFLVSENKDFPSFTEAITGEYAAQWVQVANRFLKGDPTIAEKGSLVTYENKRVMAIFLEYDAK